MSGAACWLALVALASGRPPPADDSTPVHWKQRSVPVTELPPAMQDLLLDPLDIWGAWVEDQEYELHLSDDGRVLAMVARGERQARARLKYIEETTRFVDERFFQGLEPLDLEDLEQAVTLVEFESVSDYDSALEVLKAEYPFLAVEGLRGRTGLVAGSALLGGWLEQAAGVEAWHPEHELIHRLTHLLLFQRFGELPLWVGLGAGWTAEFDLRKRIHSFPYRNEFVAIGEHAGFESTLRTAFRKREQEPLRIEELAGCERGSFDPSCAALAYGTMAFLTQFRRDSVGLILQDLQEYRVGHSRGGRFAELNQATADAQREILERRAGEDVLVEMTEFFRKGRRYRPKR